jgi:uncharacterized protein YbjT (DUF2867 family)
MTGEAARRSGRPVLVTGATGNQGGAVVRALLADSRPVRAMTRDPAQPAARRLAAQGAEVVAGNFRDPPSLARAMSGVHGVFSVQNMLADGPEQEAQDGIAVADAAYAAGVAHLVYSSVGGADRQTGIPHFESKWRIERHIASLQLPATILRPAFFIDNLITPGAWGRVMWGSLRGALGRDGPVQVIALEDIGAIAARAFAEPGAWAGRQLEIAGDEVSVRQAAAAYRRVMSRRPRYLPLAPALVAIGDKSVAAMFRWCASEGYRADIPSLRKEFPQLRDLEQGLRHGTPMTSRLRP